MSLNVLSIYSIYIALYNYVFRSEAKVPLEEELIKDFEDVLGHVGGWGRYQLTLLAISMPFTVFLSYVAYSPILFLYVPDHWCAPNPDWELLDNKDDVINWIIPTDPETGERSQCLMYDYGARNEGEVMINPFIRIIQPLETAATSLRSTKSVTTYIVNLVVVIKKIIIYKAQQSIFF